MSKIFISYRRDDTGFGADRVHEAALDYVKKRNDVFMDIDGIPPGDDFVDRIAEKVSQCDVLFALIGRDWLTIKDPKTGLRRLDGPDDFVRIEIASALKREIPVVPLLMGEAEMPSAEQLPDDLKPLVRRNARSVGRASFKHDMSELMAGLGIKRQPKQRSKLILTLIAAGLVVTFVLGAQFIFGPFSGGDVGNAGDDVAYEDETIGLRLSYYEFGPEPCDYVDITVYLRTN
ncbi:MAG: toll/interleukin-1 receptor domain-containing protein, partial [Pseudomonadota bacterium]